MAAYGTYGGYGGYGYGYGMSPSGSYMGYTPARMGAVESSSATPFEKVSGKLYTTEEGIDGSWIGAGVGAGAGAGLGALIGSHFKTAASGAAKGVQSGGRNGLIGAGVGAVLGIFGGLFAGKSLSEAEAFKHDAGDDGKFNGSRRDDFASDRTYSGAF